jgi:hypothetical protein
MTLTAIYFEDTNKSYVSIPSWIRSVKINGLEYPYSTELFEIDGKIETITTLDSETIVTGYENIHTQENISIDDFKARFGKFFEYLEDDEEYDNDAITLSERATLINRVWQQKREFIRREVPLSFKYVACSYDTNNPFIKSVFKLGENLSDIYVYHRQKAIMAYLSDLVVKHNIPFSNASHSFLRYGKLFNEYVFDEKWDDRHIQEFRRGSLNELQELYDSDLAKVKIIVDKAIALNRGTPEIDAKALYKKINTLVGVINDIKPLRKSEDDLRRARRLAKELEQLLLTNIGVES